MNNNYSINNFEVTGTDDELNDEFPEKTVFRENVCTAEI